MSEGKHEQSGALDNLLKRLGGHHHLFEHDRIANTDIPRVHKGKGYFKKALRWVLKAENNGYDALIFLIDEDGIKKRVQEIREAQNHNLLSCLPRAMGVAIRTFDAWMLADEKALTEVLGYNVNRPPNPEAIPNPKEVCSDFLAVSDTRISQSEMYARVSHEINIDILCDRCQSGFRPFAMRVRNIFQ
ncbi:MAG TPA: DUF4276 family protein [Planctomycetes bacterium]|nr:DUF4276 family protein [Planctomycetota bacterium]